MTTILLKLAGPLQAWGTSSHFEVRHTDDHPSKSAVIGILAACLGYRRNEDSELRKLDGLHFAVRVDQRGLIIRDFQTAHALKPNGEADRTYVTERYYLEDSVFVAAVGSEDGNLMAEIIDAVREPYFQPYLGRRSLPLNYDALLDVVNTDVYTALCETPWQASDWYCRRHRDIESLSIYMDADLNQGAHLTWRRDKPISFSNYGRQYELRGESMIRVKVPGLEPSMKNTEHDAFGALGD